MRLPKTLKNYELYINADPIGRIVEKVKLPSTGKKFVEINTGGLTRPLEIPVGFESSMEVTFTVQGYDIPLLLPQSCGLGATRLQFRGVLQDPGTCEEIPFFAFFTGALQYDPEDFEKGELGGGEAMLKAITAEYILNGKQIYEERVLDNVLIVNGVDLKAAENAALGY